MLPEKSIKLVDEVAQEIRAKDRILGTGLLAEFIVDKIQAARDKEWAKWILALGHEMQEGCGVPLSDFIFVDDFESLKKLAEGE